MKNSAAGRGGGIFNRGTLSLTHSQVIKNTAGVAGGGIYNGGTITVTHSPVEANTPDNCVGC